MDDPKFSSCAIAASITKSASKQTYYTIRFFVDRELRNDAYLAYAYFRWVDDILDSAQHSQKWNKAFITRQKQILEAQLIGESVAVNCQEEKMLVELIQSIDDDHPGLLSYLKNMMAILEFDATRRGKLITQNELDAYSQRLAIAVTDALYYFIGHYDPMPDVNTRYCAVNAAHITHMLRDHQDDISLGYFNFPREYHQLHKIPRHDISSSAYREWVCNRVKLAQSYFKIGRKALIKTRNIRCRLIGFAYIARFEWMLHVIERENFCLRADYSERKGLRASIWMVWNTLGSLLASLWINSSASTFTQNFPIHKT
jgi:phytoene/squalene synthetase